MRVLVWMALVGPACSGPWQLLELPPKSPQHNSHRLAQPSSFKQRGSKLCSIYGEPRPKLAATVLAAVMSLVIEPRQRVVRAYGYRGGNSEARDYLINTPHTSLDGDNVQVSIEARRSVGVVEVDRRDGSSSYCVYFKYDKDQRLSEVVLDESYVTATD